MQVGDCQTHPINRSGMGSGAHYEDNHNSQSAMPIPKILVPEVRFELTHPLGRRILSPLRLPFRHSGHEDGISFGVEVVNRAAAVSDA